MLYGGIHNVIILYLDLVPNVSLTFRARKLHTLVPGDPANPGPDDHIYPPTVQCMAYNSWDGYIYLVGWSRNDLVNIFG